MINDLIESGYENIKVVETRDGHIEQSLLSKEHFNHYMNVATFLSKSSMVPKAMQGKPSDILIAMEMGLQIGIPMMQAIQDIAVVNGKPSMYGDGLLAVVQGHPDYEWIKEEIHYDGKGEPYAVCTIKRKGHEPHVTEFSVDDAKKADLWNGKDNWKKYPERMLQHRARGFCIRDMFSDALRGIKTEEEVGDYQEVPQKENPRNALKSIISKKEKDITPVENEKPVNAVRIDTMVKRFAQCNVTQEQIEKKLGHSLDIVTEDELVSLTTIYQSLKSGSTPEEFFEVKDESRDSSSVGNTSSESS